MGVINWTKREFVMILPNSILQVIKKINILLKLNLWWMVVWKLDKNLRTIIVELFYKYNWI